MLAPLDTFLLDSFLKRSLEEDLGRTGDITTQALVAPDVIGTGAVHFRQKGRVCGLGVMQRLFSLLDSTVTFRIHHTDGTDVGHNTEVATLTGPAHALLTGERVALNLLGRLSAIATLTQACVRKAEPWGTRIADTRKTTPGLRYLEKWAVRTGGGVNHRFGLDDAVMIKDNHIAVTGSITEAVRRARHHVGHMCKIEVEVDTIDQLEEILSLPEKLWIDAVLLDNMTPDLLECAVQKVDGRLITEASGGITPDTIATVAATGVDVISLGFLTHSVTQRDVGLDLCLT